MSDAPTLSILADKFDKRHAAVQVDAANIEARVLASMTGPQSLDIHKSKAADLFGVPESAVTEEQRRVGKAINFGRMFGMSDRVERAMILSGHPEPVRFADKLRYRRTLALRKLRKFWNRLASMRARRE